MDKQLIQLAKAQSLVQPEALLAFMQVETGGQGFSPETGRLIIQFEPAWFRKRAPFAPSGKWSVNKVDVQSKEWIAFNDAAALNADAAMEATSIGIGQIMGFHWKRLGYASVQKMWVDANRGIDRQFWQLLKFIETDMHLLRAIRERNWYRVAAIYNGTAFRELAAHLGRKPYDISMLEAYDRFLNLNV